MNDAIEQLNELNNIQGTIGLPKINTMLKRTEKNFYQLISHLRLQGIPKTNNNAEPTYNLSLKKIIKKENTKQKKE